MSDWLHDWLHEHPALAVLIVVLGCLALLSLCAAPQSTSTRYTDPSARDAIDERLRRVEIALETHTAEHQ